MAVRVAVRLVAAVAMIVVMAMVVHMTRVAVAGMIVSRVCRNRIGPTFRLEWRFDFRHLAAQRNNQTLSPMQPDTVGHDLRWQMAVA